MRLHTLTMRAFGPFATEQSVDFERLAAGGLFLLDGPTGAGKTTVLDAITFALYGAGDRGGDDRLHSDFATLGVEPEVVLDFSVSGTRHRVTRSPEFERPKRRGEGTTTQAMKVHLERHEAGSWVSRSSNKAEVGDMLAEVIGLTREQFTQVVLLPQGEFAKFLRASDDERRALLTKLFGTQLYDQITDELDRRRSIAGKDVEGARQQVQLRVGGAGEAAELGKDELAELATTTSALRAERIDKLDVALRAKRATVAEVAAAAVARVDQAQRAYVLAQDHSERLARFAAARAAADAHEADRSAHAAAVAVLAAAQRAEPVRPLLEEIFETGERTQQARDGLLALHVPELMATTDTAALAAFGESTADAARVAARSAAELQHLVEREGALDQHLTALAETSVALERAGVEVERLARRQAELPGEVERKAADLAAARSAAAEYGAVTGRLEAVQGNLRAARRCEELEPQLATRGSELATAVDAHQRAVDAHQRLVEARLSGMAAELAAALVDGQPCGVCGSTDHPAPVRTAADAVGAGDVGLAAAERDSCEVRRQQAVQALAAVERDHAASAAIAADSTVAELSDEQAVLTEQLAAVTCARERIEPLEAEVADLGFERDSVSALHASALATYASAQATQSSAQRQVEELVSAVDAARDGYATVAERQRSLDMQSEHLSAVATASQVLLEAGQADAVATSRAAREATAQGFPDLDA
ncbi:MAG: SMC family ATPase, partial [Jatrophihabitantaceae bacterium]